MTSKNQLYLRQLYFEIILSSVRFRVHHLENMFSDILLQKIIFLFYT